MLFEIKEYINNLLISDKQKIDILSDYFIKGEETIFVEYPKLFSSAFNVGKKKLKLLHIAGFLYYRATLYMDSLIDENEL